MKLLYASTLTKYLLVVVMMTGLSNSGYGDQPKNPADFIRGIADEAINTLTISSLDKKTREERMLKFLDRYADIPALAKFVVGRYWSKASEEQQKEYLVVFREYNAKNFAALMASYSGQKLEVTRTHNNQGNYIVQTLITGKNSADKLQIDWQLRQQDDTYLITDFVVEGLSQAATLRDDFATSLRGANDLAKLIELLKQKIVKISQSSR